MATSTRGQLRKAPAPKGNPWMVQESTGSTIVDSIAKVEQVALASWREFVPWFKMQPDHLRLAFVAVGLVVVISVVNLSAAGFGRVATGHVADTTQAEGAAAPDSPAARVLSSESAPIIPGKAWVATQLWQGTGNHATEAFTVGSHWRVDWLYNPPPAGAFLQVFVYSSDGSLMNIATNTAIGGPDTSFWTGAGTYFLKVNSSGGDWKLDVQDYR
ncbi:MAG TPA: hypothetical protein VIN37_09785 [Candidatus Limnocylindria bacterium]